MLKILRKGLKFSKCDSLKQLNRSLNKSVVKFESRGCSQNVAVDNIGFGSMLLSRRNEASRSIVVQVQSEKSYPELHNYCAQFGDIRNAFHYRIIDAEESVHYILIEFARPQSAEEALKFSSYNEETSSIPAKSSFLWFKAGPKEVGKKNSLDYGSILPLTSIDSTKLLDGGQLFPLLQNTETLEDQITLLHKATCLNETGTRLRFLAARQIELSVSGIFTDARAFPFGSSVNGFGRMGCDLDLILRLETENNPKNSNSRLIFHTKAGMTNGRSQIQRQMETISDIMHLFLPGVCHVRRILQARVPIIKYHQEHLDLEVDLSMGNLTGLYMSELLYMFGQIDSRVQPLTFCIRRWAQSVGLTNPSPGRWISNFSLTMLVMFFLQQTNEPILPPINKLVEKARKQDFRMTEDQVNCTFLRDLNQLGFSRKNNDSLSYLLVQFFEFYSQFDFTQRAISLNSGRSLIKPDHSSMYIMNPLEMSLNVSKNVSLEETERFRIEVRNAAWIMEANLVKTKEKEPWGLLTLLQPHSQGTVKPQMFFKPRLFEIADLFHGQSEQEMPMTYKNRNVKQQIAQIKTTTKAEINKMSKNAILDLKSRLGRR